MPAAAIEGCWAPGVWADTVWEDGVWASDDGASPIRIEAFGSWSRTPSVFPSFVSPRAVPSIVITPTFRSVAGVRGFGSSDRPQTFDSWSED